MMKDTANEVIPIKNINKNRGNSLEINLVQKVVPSSLKLQDHTYE